MDGDGTAGVVHVGDMVELVKVLGASSAVIVGHDWGGAVAWTLAINAIMGLVLIFLTNLFLSPPIPINILTILISAIGGVVGWLIILVLHLLGVAFV